MTGVVHLWRKQASKDRSWGGQKPCVNVDLGSVNCLAASHLFRDTSLKEVGTLILRR